MGLTFRPQITWLSQGLQEPFPLWKQREFQMLTPTGGQRSQAGRRPCSPEDQGRTPTSHASSSSGVHSTRLPADLPAGGPEEEGEPAESSSPLHPRSWRRGTVRAETGPRTVPLWETRPKLPATPLTSEGDIWESEEFPKWPPPPLCLCEAQDIVPTSESGRTCSGLIQSVPSRL